jgi:hypothetical protein
MAQAHRKRYLPLAELVEEHPARALRILLEHAPHQGLLNVAQLSARIKGWTWLVSEGTLASDELHGFIGLDHGVGHFWPLSITWQRHWLAYHFIAMRHEGLCQVFWQLLSLQLIGFKSLINSFYFNSLQEKEEKSNSYTNVAVLL